jgi:chromosomal replication initiation ATPase DnaA
MDYTVRDDIGYDYRSLTILCFVVYATKGFTQSVLYEAKERLEERYRLQAQGYDLEKVTIRVSSELGIDPEQVWAAGKHPITVKARSLMCYWAERKLGFSATEISKKLGVSQPSVSISIKRGEKIANAMQLELIKE